jgi:hypothetical protein
MNKRLNVRGATRGSEVRNIYVFGGGKNYMKT